MTSIGVCHIYCCQKSSYEKGTLNLSVRDVEDLRLLSQQNDETESLPDIIHTLILEKVDKDTYDVCDIKFTNIAC